MLACDDGEPTKSKERLRMKPKKSSLSNLITIFFFFVKNGSNSSMAKTVAMKKVTFDQCDQNLCACLSHISNRIGQLFWSPKCFMIEYYCKS